MIFVISEDKNRKIFVNYIVVKINKFNLTIMKIDESSYLFIFFFMIYLQGKIKEKYSRNKK